MEGRPTLHRVAVLVFGDAEGFDTWDAEVGFAAAVRSALNRSGAQHPATGSVLLPSDPPARVVRVMDLGNAQNGYLGVRPTPRAWEGVGDDGTAATADR
jgi:hypothetical protein